MDWNHKWMLRIYLSEEPKINRYIDITFLWIETQSIDL